MSGRKLTVSRGYFKDEWEHKAYFVLFSALNMSLEQNWYLKWNGEIWFLWLRGFFFIHTPDRTKTFRGRQPNVIKVLVYFFLPWHIRDILSSPPWLKTRYFLSFAITLQWFSRAKRICISSHRNYKLKQKDSSAKHSINKLYSFYFLKK